MEWIRAALRIVKKIATWLVANLVLDIPTIMKQAMRAKCFASLVRKPANTEVDRLMGFFSADFFRACSIIEILATG